MFLETGKPLDTSARAYGSLEAQTGGDVQVPCDAGRYPFRLIKSQKEMKPLPASFTRAMANTVILGDLVTSTLLTLFVVPSLLLSFGKPAPSRMALAQTDLRPAT